MIRPQPTRVPTWAVTLPALAFAAVLTACGGGDDSIPAGSPARPSNGVLVESVSEATADGAIWLTRAGTVTVSGEADAGARVEARDKDSERLISATTARSDGGFDMPLLVQDGSNVFVLVATAPGGRPGPPTDLRVFRRTTPPRPFEVTPRSVEPTSADSIPVTVTTERDIVVMVRVTVNGRALPEVRKQAGEATVGVSVPLDRDQTNRIEVRGTELAGNTAGPVVINVVQDSSAPTTPEVDPPHSPVRGDSAVLTGRAPGAARIEVTNVSPRRTAEVGPLGAFSVTVPLEEGQNRFEMVAVDAAGNRSGSVSVVVERDTVKPPAPSQLSADVNDRVVTVSGRSEPGTAVVVAADPSGVSQTGTAVPDTGAFSVVLALEEYRRYDLTATATDRAGNRSDPATTTVDLTPPDTTAPQPPQVQSVSGRPVGDGTVTVDTRDIVLSGAAEAGSRVTATSGGASASETAADGTFGIELRLPADGPHRIEVVARDAANNASAPATLTVVVQTPPSQTVPEGPLQETAEPTVVSSRSAAGATTR